MQTVETVLMEHFSLGQPQPISSYLIIIPGIIKMHKSKNGHYGTLLHKDIFLKYTTDKSVLIT